MRVIVQSAMHKRQEVVLYCLDWLHDLAEQVEPEIDLHFLYGYTLEEDGQFLKQFPRVTSYQAPNEPLAQKFNIGVKRLQSMDFDLAIMIGSDDMFDEKYLRFVVEQSKTYEHIAFLDIYFLQILRKRHYYWPGYEIGIRRGEPAGAGKVYTRKALESLDFNLFVQKNDRGLDRDAYERTKHLKKRFFKLKEEGLYLCDVKEGKGKTPLGAFKNLEQNAQTRIFDEIIF